MALLLVQYFLWMITAITLGLIVYKVFDKILDFLVDLSDLICHNG